jgi:hypothetical protein
VGLAGSGLVRLGNEPQERFEVLAEADQVDDLQRSVISLRMMQREPALA